MAHEITSTDNLFSTRKPTWHGLGVILPEYPTREQAQAIAHPWEPVTTPVFTREADPLGDQDHTSDKFSEIDGFKAVTRSDTGAVLGVVGEGYQPVSNSDLWDIAEAIQGSGADVMYETAGSLQGGGKVWVMLRLNEPIMVPGDPHGETIPYYALQNSHNGSGSFRGQAITTRIVCANTSQIADMDARARGTEFTFRHTKNIGERVEEARSALAGWRGSLAEWQDQQRWLLTLPVTPADIFTFVDRFIPIPPLGAASERVRSNADEAQRVFLSILNGETCEGIKESAYGLVQASIEYGEHFRKSQSRETQFKRTYLDRNRVVQDARRLALSVAGA